MSTPEPIDPGLPRRVEGLSPRVPLDVDVFRIANPAGTINVPLTDPYEVLPDPAAPWYDTEPPGTYTTDIPENPTRKAATMSGETTITVIGNLTADPELRHTPVSGGFGKTGGTPVANFTIASTPRSFDTATNSWKDGDTLFLRATAWRDAAEHAAASLTKGSRVIASGVLKPRSYETKTGEKRTVIELEIEEIGISLRFGPATASRTGNSLQPSARDDHDTSRPGDAPEANPGGYAADDPWFGKDANPAGWAGQPDAAAEPSF